MKHGLVTVSLDREDGVVAARQRARVLARLLHFDPQDQTRIAAAVSEVARNAYRYAGGGRAEFALESAPGKPAEFVVTVVDQGPGIAHLDAILAGDHTAASGPGMGLIGARRLMDSFEVESAPGRGTRVRLAKRLHSEEPADARHAAEIAQQLARESPLNPLQEAEEQTRQLVSALGELRTRHEEVMRLNRELEDTNRGVLALYAELDERATALRRANDVKAQFLSYMSHEFRTPLDSILFLSQMLREGRDGDLNGEQERQVTLIATSAQTLLGMVDDLLETARVDAGKVTIRPARFEVRDLFSEVRALLRPLMGEARVPVVFEEPGKVPALNTDEARVSQIVRNFITNALKFTEKGEIRVRASYDEEEDAFSFSVRDTGIGIAPEDVERIFLDFDQVENVAQRRVRGTGLGLPLSRRLAGLLGGLITVESQPGVGSTFTLTLPRVYSPPGAATQGGGGAGGPGAARADRDTAARQEPGS